jgi:DNA processing protein
MGCVSDEILLARAFLNRVAEPDCVPLWIAVRRDGPVDTAAAIMKGRARTDVLAATAGRAATADPHADLEAAQRRGVRLVVPESDEWPHFALAALEATGARCALEYERRRAARGRDPRAAERSGSGRHQPARGEPIPPLALWARGPVNLAPVGVRSVGIVGARAATSYGEEVAAGLAYGLAGHDFVVVSGGAYGIDAAAHRAALAAQGETVLVSAGGLDRAYPPGNAALFERVAETGLLMSESPPGAAPQRRRFLTRNRLIAALSTGTVVVEAALRSGAANTALHCAEQGRPVMAVPGPVTSSMSVGCHKLLAAERNRAELVTGVDDVLLLIGGAGDLPATGSITRPRVPGLREQLDGVDPTAQRVFDGFPARRAITAEELVVTSGLTLSDVIRSLPLLELSGLVEETAGGYRLRRTSRPVAAPDENGS